MHVDKLLGDQATAQADRHRVGPGARLKLRQQMTHVRLHGLLRQEEPLADLAVHEAVRDQSQDRKRRRRNAKLTGNFAAFG